jgi:RimJ/RimL family protein N-acetyltransferase
MSYQFKRGGNDPMLIRHICEDDAEAFLRLCRQLDQETTFMMLEPGERTTTVEQQRERIKNVLSVGTIFVADHNGELVGYLSAAGGAYRRNRHNVYIVIGILQAFAGQGIGTRLFTDMESWARERGAHRLELSVIVNNERGIALYRKMGFEVEGTKRDSMLVNGAYVDEYYMAKMLA